MVILQKIVRRLGLTFNQYDRIHRRIYNVKKENRHTVVEALYCGTPVVSTPVGIAAEIIDEGNGALCGGTPYEIAQAIKRVLGNKYNQTEIRQLATEKFAPENVAKQYIALYNETLKD